MENNVNTPLTKEEQKAMLKSLIKEHTSLFRFSALSEGLVFILICLSLYFARHDAGACVTLSFFALIVLSVIFFIFLIPHIKITRAFRKDSYTYHYLDITEYSPGNQLHDVYYELDGFGHVAYTTILGATKIHVFDCYGEHLTTVEEPFATDSEREE